MKEIQRIEISSNELRGNLGNYINKASFGGQEIVITRRGKPLAKLIGIEQKSTDDTDEIEYRVDQKCINNFTE